MSTLEKILSVVVGIFVVGMIVIFFNEFREQPEDHQAPTAHLSDFDESAGQNFVIGPFATVVDQHSSGGEEANCGALYSIIAAALHDINTRLREGKTSQSFFATNGKFEVNMKVVQLFCEKNAQITLADSAGDQLLLEKVPFTRVVPAHGTSQDEGTDVRINATLTVKGQPKPAQPTTYGDILIPDQFLDSATSSWF